MRYGWREVSAWCRRFASGGVQQPPKTQTPGRKYNELTFEEAVAEWLGRIEVPDNKVDKDMVVDFGIHTEKIWVRITLDLTVTTTGEVMAEQEQWIIERCSGDVWTRDGHHYRLLSNIYGRYRA